MRIKEKINQHRRDFTAIFECEHCGSEVEAQGYDDANYHYNVIPNMKCINCSKTAGDDYKPMETVYPEGQQV